MPVDEPIDTDQGASEDRLPSESDSEANPREWLTRGDQLFLIAVSLVILVLLVVRTYSLMVTGGETIDVKHLSEIPYTFQLDINTATWVEWMQLDGVGEAMGRRIVADREENGPFTSIEDVQRVKGIGAITLDKMRQHLKCEECEANQ